ncbi:MAG: PQQ-binding-like beta-propeller repeat protein, partial [Planctomycetota bacterium]
MTKPTLLLLWLAMFAASGAFSACAENWPCWRGPRGDGTSADRAITAWDGVTGDNIVWKTPIPGGGHASPIVWEDRVFQTTYLPDSNARTLLCIDRASGRTLWRKTVVISPEESKHDRNSYASGTPATDGELVFVTFLEVDGRATAPALNVSAPRMITPGKMVVAAYDFAGNQRWLIRPGDFVSVHGYCSCPVLFENLVIVNGDHDGDSYLVALDKSTGNVVWKTPRRHKTRSYVTPIIRRIDGQPRLVLSGSRCVAAFDPRDGKLLWSVDGPTEQFVASMVFDGDHFFVVGGYPTHHVMAIRPGGVGDVTQSHVAWHVRNAKSYVPSPVVVDDYLIVADDRGTAGCFA